MADLSVAQKAAVDALMTGLRNAERNAIFNAVADLWEIIPPPVPDVLEPVAEQVRREWVRVVKTVIDAVAPNLTDQERRRAIKLALDAL